MNVITIKQEAIMEIKDAKVFHDYLNGVIEGEDVKKSTKLYADAKTFYSSVDSSISDDQIMYEVYSYEHDGLCYGLTVMQPVCVNGECNVTRGHFHENLDCDEIYCGMGGEGILLLMDEDYHCHAEKVKCGSVHYIDGHLAHRLVNTGNSELKVQCMWPSNAGHDYKRVEEHPFTVRVYKENGELKVEEE